MSKVCKVCIFSEWIGENLYAYLLWQVKTETTHDIQGKWWPTGTNEGTQQKPTYTKDSTYRNEFMYTKQLAPKPHFRHSANPNRKPACGVGGYPDVLSVKYCLGKAP